MANPRLTFLGGMAALGLLFAPRLSSAQSPYLRGADVRTPAPEVVMKDRKVWGADLSFGGNATRGNSRTGLITAGTALFRAWGPSTLYLAGSALHQTAGKRQLQNQGRATLRYDHSLGGPWKLFVFNTHAYNDLLRLDYRSKIGAGPWYDLRIASSRLGLGLAFAHVYERFQGGVIERTQRLSLRQTSRLPISSVAELRTELFYVPALKDFRDHHIDGEIALQTSIWKDVLSLRLGWLAEYDSRPKPDVVSTDTFWTASLVAQFGR